MSEMLRIPYVRRADQQHGYLELRIERNEEGSACLHLPLYDDLPSRADYAASDVFECLAQLRADLERHDIFLLCQGARVDVYPSRMARQMGDGRSAYKMVMGKQAEADDLVDIFEVVADEHLGTVAQQRQYWETWMDS